MFTCGDVKERMNAFNDKELSMKERFMVLFHLVICEPCSMMIRFNNRIKKMVSRHSNPPMDPKCKVNILKRLKEEKEGE